MPQKASSISKGTTNMSESVSRNAEGDAPKHWGYFRDEEQTEIEAEADEGEPFRSRPSVSHIDVQQLFTRPTGPYY